MVEEQFKHLLLAACLTLQSFLVCQANSTVDSLKMVISSRQDTFAVHAHFSLMVHYYQNGLLDSAYQHVLEAEFLARELDYTPGKIRSWRSLTAIEGRRGNYDESYNWSEIGLKFIEEEKLPLINKVDLLINRGVGQINASYVSKAIETYREAAQICRENEFEQKRAVCLNNLGVLFRMAERYDEAISIYEEVLAYRTEKKDSMGMANNLFNMGSAYAKMKAYGKSLESIEKAQDLYEQLGSEHDIILCEISKGSALFDLERYEESKKLLYPLAAEEGLSFESNNLAVLFLTSCKLHLKDLDPKAALKDLDRIEELVKDSDFHEYKAHYLEQKAKALFALDRHKEAYQVLDEHRIVLKEFNKEETVKMRREMEEKYLSQEKDYQIDLLNSENEIAELEVKAANQRSIALGIGIAVFGIVSLILYQLYRRIQQQNIVISEANHQKETLLKEIHHRVKNNLQVISSLLSLQSRQIEDPTALEALNEGRNRVKSMALIHQNLYLDENLVGVNSLTYIDKLTQSLLNNYQVSEGKIELSTDVDELNIDVDTIIPIGLILNELVSNSLKYAFVEKKDGKIVINLKQIGENLELSVSDNGKGLPDSFSPSTSKSLGYRLITSFARKLKADLQIFRPEKGTLVKLSIPYASSV